MRRQCKCDCCHTCSSRSPSEKPAASTLLPLCPLGPGLTRLVLLNLVDAAEKVKQQEILFNRQSSNSNIKSAFCQALWLRTSVFHLSFQVCYDNTTDLFNDSDHLVCCTIESFVSRHMRNVKQVFIILLKDYTLLPPRRPEKATLFGKDQFFAHKSTFCQEQDRPPEGAYFLNIFRTKTFSLTRNEKKCHPSVFG